MWIHACLCAEGTIPRWISRFTFQVSRVVEDAVTGSVADIASPRFWIRLDRKQAGDVLIVTILGGGEGLLMTDYCLLPPAAMGR